MDTPKDAAAAAAAALRHIIQTIILEELAAEKVALIHQLAEVGNLLGAPRDELPRGAPTG
jgi:hypothetical protein